ncbi:MAG: UDP-N-acetylglucosamine 2-epimerase, partial [bacterium]
MSPIIRFCERKSVPMLFIHTGQHYTYSMDRIFFQELKLPEPTRHLDIGSHSHGKQTGLLLTGLEEALQEEKPGIVLVQGDTNTVLAGGLAASKLSIPVGHVEAGLRSYDRTMPEEINRVLVDHLSSFLFVPTENAKRLLLKEGISEDNIFITGNTIVDAVNENKRLSMGKSGVLEQFGLKKGEYFLVTL